MKPFTDIKAEIAMTADNVSYEKFDGDHKYIKRNWYKISNQTVYNFFLQKYIFE